MNNFAIRLILADVRSAHNVGAILRTADACAVELVYACGYTPYPHLPGDSRPAHIAAANHRSIAKTALGAEIAMPVVHLSDTLTAIREAQSSGFKVMLIEQAENSLNLYHFSPSSPLALVFGNEIDGISSSYFDQADAILELPMLGGKESLNVAVTAGIALYQLRFGT
jgi:23S rRNA (guanosine2251-2'-O)-methyltransferase